MDRLRQLFYVTTTTTPRSFLTSSDVSNSDEELLTLAVELLLSSFKDINPSRSISDSSESGESDDSSRSTITDETLDGRETLVNVSKLKITLAISETLATSPNRACQINKQKKHFQ